jgi:hypothetical protein
MRMDRHFIFMYGRSGEAVVIELFFFEGSDILERVIERKVKAFREAFRSCKVTIPTETNGKTRDVATPIADLWLDRNDRPQKLWLGFEPCAARRAADLETLSLFNGLQLDASLALDAATAAAHPGTQIFLRHFRECLADGNASVFNYLVSWHAFAVQKRRKVGTIPLFIGDSGSGKSILYSKLSRALRAGVDLSRGSLFAQIFGQTYLCTTGLDQLIARFNMNQGGKLFVVSEEIANEKGTANKDTLKGLAENQTMDLEGKFFDTVAVPDHRNIVMLSNHRHALVDTNRKFLVIQVSNRFCTENRAADAALDREAETYFRALGTAMANPEAVRHFFWYLMTLDISQWSAEPVPVTPLMQQLAIEVNPIPVWLRAFRSGELDELQLVDATEPRIQYVQGKHITSTNLLALFHTWATQNGFVIPWTDVKFYSELGSFARADLQHKLLRHSTHGINGKGYIMTAAPLQVAQ